ncbi:MAG: hypothetical protein ACKVJG_09780 [Candidatus Latescibacterota bacterium]
MIRWVFLGFLFWCASCAVLQKKAPDVELTQKAKAMLNEGDFVEALLIRRFTGGRLLVRLQDGAVFFLDPKKTCSWCWIYVDRRVYVDIGERTAVLVSPKGDAASVGTAGAWRSFDGLENAQ